MPFQYFAIKYTNKKALNILSQHTHGHNPPLTPRAPRTAQPATPQTPRPSRTSTSQSSAGSQTSFQAPHSQSATATAPQEFLVCSSVRYILSYGGYIPAMGPRGPNPSSEGRTSMLTRRSAPVRRANATAQCVSSGVRRRGGHLHNGFIAVVLVCLSVCREEEAPLLHLWSGRLPYPVEAVSGWEVTMTSS